MYPVGYPALDVAGKLANLRLFITGKPVPKGRPRSRVMSAKGTKPFVQVYTDDETASWEESVSWQSRAQVSSLSRDDGFEVALPFRDRVVLTLCFNFEKPKSTAKSVAYPVKSRTDVDNLAKAVMDALQNAGVLVNDNIVTDLIVMKRFTSPGHPQGVEVDLTAWGAVRSV